MDMKLKSALIKKLRSERLWSQDQLAQFSGLGLRTIQRIESQGSGSKESLMALSSVFGVPVESLVWSDDDYTPYSHRQWGIATFLALAVLMALILLISHFTGLNISDAQINPNQLRLIQLVLFSLLGIIAVVFSSMTISVNESEVTWFFGPGLLKRKLALTEVASCRKIVNPWWLGFGIHSFGTGWLYNVSGFLGVEIELKGGAFVRLGTNEPNYLVSAVEKAKDRARKNSEYVAE